VIDAALIFLLAVSLGGWWSARRDCAAWKRAFVNLFNQLNK